MSRHIYALADARLTTPSIVTIGVFDGVHVGHQQLVKRLVQEARAGGRTSVVIAFFPHPDVVLKGAGPRYYLTSPDVRARLLLELGVDLVITHPFSREVSQIRAADFVAQLREHLNLAALWVGPDFALGYKREGNVTFLKAQGRAMGFSVDTVDLRLSTGGEVISSSRIREVLQAGDVGRVMAWLGRPYAVTGVIVDGDHRGRQIGFPTANLDVWEEQVLPANGVYVCWAYHGDERLMAVSNVGVQPTFDGAQKMKVEAHLIDFSGDLYGEELRLEFLQHLRPEKRFSSIDALIAQITSDVAEARRILQALREREQG